MLKRLIGIQLILFTNDGVAAASVDDFLWATHNYAVSTKFYSQNSAMILLFLQNHISTFFGRKRQGTEVSAIV